MTVHTFQDCTPMTYATQLSILIHNFSLLLSATCRSQSQTTHLRTAGWWFTPPISVSPCDFLWWFTPTVLLHQYYFYHLQIPVTGHTVKDCQRMAYASHVTFSSCDLGDRLAFHENCRRNWRTAACRMEQKCLKTNLNCFRLLLRISLSGSRMQKQSQLKTKWRKSVFSRKWKIVTHLFSDF